jgi:hypothetical protein
MDLRTVSFFESGDDIEISRFAYVGVQMGDKSERHRELRIFPQAYSKSCSFR